MRSPATRGKIAVPRTVGAATRFGRKIAPVLSPILNRYPCAPALSFVARAICGIQGKAGGSGWDRAAESKVVAAFVRTSRPVIFDIGANQGEWAQNTLAELDRPCEMYLFDPSPDCCDVLRALNLENAQVVQAAVSNAAGRKFLYSSSKTSGTASLFERRDSCVGNRKYTAQEVEVITLDEFIIERGIARVDFIKMDVEGSEFFALQGAKDALNSKIIKSMAFEFGSGNINSRTYFIDFWDYLSAFGYQFWRITPGGYLLQINEYREDMEYFDGVANYVAALESPYAH